MAEEKKESSGLKGLADRAQDMVGGLVGRAAQAGTTDADTFVANAVLGNGYELAAGKLALQRARSERVREMARVLVEDHITADHQLRSTLRALVSPPSLPGELDERHTKMIEHLAETPDDDFDDRFLEQQVLAHQESLTLFRSFAEKGENPWLRLYAQATAPSLERHLAHAKQMRGA